MVFRKQKGGTPIRRHVQIIKAARSRSTRSFRSRSGRRLHGLDATGERLYETPANKLRRRARGGGISFRFTRRKQGSALRRSVVIKERRFPTIHRGDGTMGGAQEDVDVGSG